jgi:hypothetical protein
MSSHALPLLELNIDSLRRVRDEKMDLIDVDLAGDLDILREKLKTGKIKLIQIHLEDALENYKNKFRVELELREVERYLWALYRQVGYSVSPKGEKWDLKQLEARRIMKELEELKSQFKTSLISKLEMSKILANYQMRCEKLSEAAAKRIKECADYLSKGKIKQCSLSLFRTQKELARFILSSS